MKYRKKGWSDAKIQRAHESHMTPAGRPAGLRDDLLELITDLTNEFGVIRLSLHWYSGDVETENFALNDAGRITLKAFREDVTSLRDETTTEIKGEQDAAGQPPPAGVSP